MFIIWLLCLCVQSSYLFSFFSPSRKEDLCRDCGTFHPYPLSVYGCWRWMRDRGYWIFADLHLSWVFLRHLSVISCAMYNYVNKENYPNNSSLTGSMILRRIMWSDTSDVSTFLCYITIHCSCWISKAKFVSAMYKWRDYMVSFGKAHLFHIH